MTEKEGDIADRCLEDGRTQCTIDYLRAAIGGAASLDGHGDGERTGAGSYRGGQTAGTCGGA